MAIKEWHMASYSVANTKDHLSQLIDKALAGEEVVITRRGKATVELKVVAAKDRSKTGKADWMERLRLLRESLPTAPTSAVDLVRLDREESEH
jgi:antitoxin (DNA-binding transcriptional repressor) of toxin-antitoxin stability system